MAPPSVPSAGTRVLQECDGRGEHLSRRWDQQEGHQAAAHRRHQGLKEEEDEEEEIPIRA